MQIYADNRVDTPQGKRDIIFSFHHTEEETAQYDNWQSGKKNFTLDMDSSKPDESEYLGTSEVFASGRSRLTTGNHSCLDPGLELQESLQPDRLGRKSELACR